jgi:hypothetical protein
MRRSDVPVFLDAAGGNHGGLAFHAVAGLAFIGSCLGFSAMIAVYFGYVMPLPFAASLVLPKTLALVAATALALLAVASRLAQSYIEARTMVRREQAFAIRVGQSSFASPADANLVRAANHYGRLSAVCMKAVSTLLVLLASGIAFMFILPASYLTAFALTSAIGIVALYGVMNLLYRAMEEASRNLFANAKEASVWKLQPGDGASDGVQAYFRAYFRRVFLASAFGVTGMAFAVVFCLLLIVYTLVGGAEITFGDAFVAFMLLQAYLGLVGRLFGAAVQGAAFVPALRPFLAPGTGQLREATEPPRVTIDIDDVF